MIALLALATFATQTYLPAPDMPPGSDSRYHHTIIHAEECLEKGDFAGANKWLAMLPGTTVTFSVDLKHAPAKEKVAYEKLVTDALQRWVETTRLISLKKVASNAQLAFSFGEKLVDDPTAGVPYGVTIIAPEEPDGRGLDIVIGLNRGKPLKPATSADIFNAALKAMGQYLGVSSTPYEAFSTGPGLLSGTYRNAPSGDDTNTYKACFQAAQSLRDACKRHQRVHPKKASFVVPEDVDMGKVYRGDLVPFTFSIANNGADDLKVRVKPDCSCLTAVNLYNVQPGRTALGVGDMDTTHVTGDFAHKLLFYTNDPDHPMLTVPIHALVTEPQEILRKEGKYFVVPPGGGDYEAVIVPASDYPFTSKIGQVMAVPGDVKIEPFEGEYLGKQVKGFKAKIHIDDKFPVGRFGTQIRIDRWSPKNEKLNPIIWEVDVQRGIAALPDLVNMGDLDGGETFTVLLSRPYQPFKITSITSPDPHITITYKQTELAGEYSLQLKYVGGGALGSLEKPIKIKTDDKSQPEIDIPVQAVIRR